MFLKGFLGLLVGSPNARGCDVVVVHLLNIPVGELVFYTLSQGFDLLLGRTVCPKLGFPLGGILCKLIVPGLFREG